LVQLTVAIPTYNRNEVLRTSLAHLLPQLNEQCRLLIVDNHSEIPVEDSLRDLVRQYPRVTCRFVRNRCNVGGAANILRCFELCDTEWMWLLGDDEHAAPNATETILRSIKEHPSCLFLHFGSPNYCHLRSYATSGLREFVESIDSWSHLNFMSVGVYNIPAIQPKLRLGHHFAYSFSPHPALLLASIGERGCCWFSDEPIIGYQAQPEWSELNVLLGKMTLLELLPDDNIRRTFAAKISRLPSLEAVTVILTKAGWESHNPSETLFQYDQICNRLYYYHRPPLGRLRMFAYRLMVRWPSISYVVLKKLFPLLARMTGYGHMHLEQIACPDRFLRA